MRRFDPPAIFAALDAERRRHGLTWARLAAQTGVAESTLRRTREQGRFEADGVLAMAQWLGRPVEDFIRAGESPPEALR